MLGQVIWNAGKILVPDNRAMRLPAWIGACHDCGQPWTETPSGVVCLSCESRLWIVQAKPDNWSELPRARLLEGPGKRWLIEESSCLWGRLTSLEWEFTPHIETALDVLNIGKLYTLARCETESKDGGLPKLSPRIFCFVPWREWTNGEKQRKRARATERRRIARQADTR